MRVDETLFLAYSDNGGDTMKHKCKCEWCSKEAVHCGWCNQHYQQVKTYGHPVHTRNDKHIYYIKDDGAYIPLYNEQHEVYAEIIIDVEDIERVCNYKWHSKTNDFNHVYGKVDGKMTMLHRFLLGVNDSNIIVDHVNRNPLDNRKCNLRITDSKGNARNQTKPKSNTTGYKNISMRNGKYRVTITKDYKRHELGMYNTLEEAIKVRDEWLIKLHGEFASQG